MEGELDNFRREWLAETNHNQQNKRREINNSILPIQSTSSSSSNGISTSPTTSSLNKINSVTTLESGFNELNLEYGRTLLGGIEESITIESKPLTALEFYQEAVISEQQGRLNDSVTAYRKAFKLDPEIDRTYHKASLTAELTNSIPLPNGAFKFNRTIQFGPDYHEDDHIRSDDLILKGIGQNSNVVDSNHPSSTGFLLNSLLRSIVEHPYVRSESVDHITPVEEVALTVSTLPKLTTEEVQAQISFLPEDPTLPLHFNKIPREVLLLILRAILLNSVTPPLNSHAPEPLSTSPVQVSRKRKKQLTPKEEMRSIELELNLDVEEEELARKEWKSDVEALERFASTCRAARIITLESSLWRDLCLRTYVPPQVPPHESAYDTVRSLHSNDWRRFYIEHPRIRLDGVYIAVITYLRRGDTQGSWYSPTHLITFYRYLRFYPSGLVISLQTVEPPNTIVKRLNPSLRLKGCTFGKWSLFDTPPTNTSDSKNNNNGGTEVRLWDLEDPSILPRGIRKYSFRMECKFGSTARGRMNKLEMKGLKTVRKSDDEIEDVPIRPTKPYYFSKVSSYAGEDE